MQCDYSIHDQKIANLSLNKKEQKNEKQIKTAIGEKKDLNKGFIQKKYGDIPQRKPGETSMREYNKGPILDAWNIQSLVSLIMVNTQCNPTAE